MPASRNLRMIYREIPAASPCKPGCTDCCGPVPWSPDELARVQTDIPLSAHWIEMNGVRALENPITGKCPFASVGGCTVYERRPFMCRLFASVSASEPRLACPHGCCALKPLSARQTTALTDRYRQTQQRQGV